MSKKNRNYDEAFGCAAMIFAFFAGIALICWAIKS